MDGGRGEVLDLDLGLEEGRLVPPVVKEVKVLEVDGERLHAGKRFAHLGDVSGKIRHREEGEEKVDVRHPAFIG